MRLLDKLFPDRVVRRERDALYAEHTRTRLAAAKEQLEHQRKIRKLSLDRQQQLTDALMTELHVQGTQASRATTVRPTLEGCRAALKEDTTSQYGNPWQMEISGMALDQAWRLGFPSVDNSYFYADDTIIAHDDSLRMQVLRLCRYMYSQHPHAKAMVNACVNFVVGPKSWTVDPAPAKPDFDDDQNIRQVPVQEGDKQPSAVREDLYQGDAGEVDPVGDIIAPVSTDPDNDVEDDESDENKPKHLTIVATPDVGLQRKLRKLWRRYARRGKFTPTQGWKQFWTEAYRRTRVDGECFIHLGNDINDGRLTPRFIDPLDIRHPQGLTAMTGIFDAKANGIEVDPDDPARVIGYHFKRYDQPDMDPQFIKAENMIHIKFGVNETVRRGLPMLFCARQYLRHFDTWISQSLKHQKVQTMIAVLRQWEDADESLLTNMRDTAAVRTFDRSTPAGNTLRYSATDQMPIVDAPQGMNLTMTQPNGNYSDSEILARRVLLACAAGMNLSECMVTADGSNANYASTRITQFVPIRYFEGEQGDWSETLNLYYEKWCYAEAAAGRIPPVKDENALLVTITPCRLPDFEGEVATAMVCMQLQNEVIDLRTAREMLNHDPDRIKQRMEEDGGEPTPTGDKSKAGQPMKGVAQPGQQQPGAQPEANVDDDPIDPVGYHDEIEPVAHESINRIAHVLIEGAPIGNKNAAGKHLGFGKSKEVDSILAALPSHTDWQNHLIDLPKSNPELEGFAAIDDQMYGAGLCVNGSCDLQKRLAANGVSTRLVDGYHGEGGGSDSEHTWLQTKSGVIIDSTPTQFRSVGQVDKNPYKFVGEIHVIKPGTPKYKLYQEADVGRSDEKEFPRGFSKTEALSRNKRMPRIVEKLFRQKRERYSYSNGRIEPVEMN